LLQNWALDLGMKSSLEYRFWRVKSGPCLSKKDSSTNSAYADTKLGLVFLAEAKILANFEAWLVAAGRAEGPAGAEFQSQEKKFFRNLL
jgi:hypothetical protein